MSDENSPQVDLSDCLLKAFEPPQHLWLHCHAFDGENARQHLGYEIVLFVVLVAALDGDLPVIAAAADCESRKEAKKTDWNKNDLAADNRQNGKRDKDEG